jgi:hypothetical protein
METYRTTRCQAHRHPEFTLTFRAPRPAPIERILLEYFERSVAAGVRFAAGQTVRVGSVLFRLVGRADGTFGVEEREGDQWVEHCDRGLFDVWLQKEIVASVGLELSFPSEDQTAMCARCAFEAPGASSERWPDPKAAPARALVMTRLPPEEGFSGWSFACERDHDHGERRFGTLREIGDVLPHAKQFFALPPGAVVLLVRPAQPSGGRIRAHVFFDDRELEPAPGSYLDALGRE